MSIFDIFNQISKERTKPAAPIEYIICGLGNPGSQYENTRHNSGFMTIDTLAEELKFDIKKLKFKSLTADVTIDGRRCLIMKPTTFMNKSGEAVAEALNFYKLTPSSLVVICDDVTQDVGRLRIRRKGSDGGQNGLKNIILSINSDEFVRIRVGVGKKPHPDYNLADWVLSNFTKDEGVELEKSLNNAVSAIRLIVSGKTDEAMNKYNGKG